MTVIRIPDDEVRGYIQRVKAAWNVLRGRPTIAFVKFSESCKIDRKLNPGAVTIGIRYLPKK